MPIDTRISQTTPATAATDAALAPVAPSPTGTAMLPQWLIRWATVFVLACGVEVAAAQALPFIPATVTGVCLSIVALGAALGISSQGVRSPPTTPTTPTTPRITQP